MRSFRTFFLQNDQNRHLWRFWSFWRKMGLKLRMKRSYFQENPWKSSDHFPWQNDPKMIILTILAKNGLFRPFLAAATSAAAAWHRVLTEIEFWIKLDPSLQNQHFITGNLENWVAKNPKSAKFGRLGSSSGWDSELDQSAIPLPHQRRARHRKCPIFGPKIPRILRFWDFS